LPFGNSSGQTIPATPASDEDVPTVYEVFLTGSNIPTTERVIVTASTIPTAAEAGPQPLDIYRRDDLTRLGMRTAVDLVQKLPIATGAASNDAQPTGLGHTELNLRGILAKETLVLVDGRRVAPVGFAGATADLNLIPLGLVDHIDILKDGASAIYGNDAVTGVFNVWLIHKFRGLELYTSYGNTNLGASNDQAEVQAYLLTGTGDEKTDIVVYAELYDRAAIFSRDRGLSSNADFTRYGGRDLRSGFFAGRVGSFVLQPGLLSPTGGPGQAALGSHPFTTPAASGGTYVSRGNVDRNSNDFLFNVAALTSAVPAANRQYYYGSFQRDIFGNFLQLFADFRYTHSSWEAMLAPSPFTNDPFGITNASGVSVPLQNPYNPFSRANTTVNGVPFVTGVRYRALEAGPRDHKVVANNNAFTAGLRGTLKDVEANDLVKTWGYELGFRYNRDERSETLSNVVDLAMLRIALLSTDPSTSFDVFGRNLNGSGIAGRTNRAVLSNIFATTHHHGDTSLTLEDAKAYGDVWNLRAGPLSVAFGSEHRKETANDFADALSAPGQNSGGIFPPGPTKGNRDVWSAFWEIRAPITSPQSNFYGCYSLEAGYQERFDEFSDFGSTERPKFFLRWQPFDSSLTLRGTYTEAFHAPTLYELFNTEVDSFTIVFDPATNQTGQITSVSGGNPNLKPEVAYEWTYGAVWSPKFIPGLTLSADWYHIDERNMTGVPDPNLVVEINNNTASFFGFNGVPLNGLFQQLIVRDPVTGQIVSILATEQNIARTITEGLDYGASYRFETSRLGRGDFGALTLTVNGTYLSRYEFQFNPGDKPRDRTGSGPGGNFGNLTHHRFYASLYYDYNGFEAGMAMHFAGQYNDDAAYTNSGEPRKVREWYTFDLSASYTFHFASSEGREQVAGHATDDGKGFGKDQNVPPVSTAAYADRGWRAWLNGMTLTFGVNNVFDADPPFVASALENGFDEGSANVRGRVWYLAVKKRF
jgi:iron complex outermembrane receptor protein